MLKIPVIRFKPIEEQDCCDLDDGLIPHWHIIQDTGQGEYTACGQAITEYHYDIKKGKVTCPTCLEIIRFYKELGTKKQQTKKSGGNDEKEML